MGKAQTSPFPIISKAFLARRFRHANKPKREYKQHVQRQLRRLRDRLTKCQGSERERLKTVLEQRLHLHILVQQRKAKTKKKQTSFVSRCVTFPSLFPLRTIKKHLSSITMSQNSDGCGRRWSRTSDSLLFFDPPCWNFVFVTDWSKTGMLCLELWAWGEVGGGEVWEPRETERHL